MWSGFFDKMEEVEKQVKDYMDQAVKVKNKDMKGIVEDTLTIEVTSNLVPNLTLLDLPGIVAATRKGEPAGKRNLHQCHSYSYLFKTHLNSLSIWYQSLWKIHTPWYCLLYQPMNS
jgi:hypothetical protein